MADMSNYLENKLCNHIFRNMTFNSPAFTYIGLFTSSAGLEENNLLIATEVTEASYSRLPCSSATFTAPSDGMIENVNALIFPTATTNWGSITHIALLDAATDGNVLMWKELTSPESINIGDSLRFLSGDLDLSFA